MIYEILAAKWYRNDGYLDMEEVIMTVYRYSRELEHSDQNLATMDELLDEVGADEPLDETDFEHNEWEDE